MSPPCCLLLGEGSSGSQEVSKPRNGLATFVFQLPLPLQWWLAGNEASLFRFIADEQTLVCLCLSSVCVLCWALRSYGGQKLYVIYVKGFGIRVIKYWFKCTPPTQEWLSSSGPRPHGWMNGRVAGVDLEKSDEECARCMALMKKTTVQLRDNWVSILLPYL